jgi:hypothetical protein
MNRVWPNRIVEENSLQAQISALRNAFGADRNLIRTISGRGYQFTGEIRTVAASPHAQAVAGTAVQVPAPPRPPTNLPKPVFELIHRDLELEEILGLAGHRLVTLTGAGGIGKTRLGLEVARRLLPKFADGVWVIELAPLSDPDLVPITVATALGLDLADDVVSPERVAHALAARQLLLVLDNCEHLVGAAPTMAEALLRANPAARVMATSRESLRAEGECVYRVPPLAVPTEGSEDAEDPLRYGALRLFVARARAAEPQFSPDVHVAAAIVAICRHLDGIPLPDPATVVFHLKFATGAFLPALADPYAWIYKKEILGKDPRWYEKNVMGSGPFKFAEYQLGQSIKGVRNSDYYHQGLPYLDGFTGIYADKQAVRIDAIRADRAAMEFRGLPPSARDQLVKEVSDKIAVQESDWNCGNLVTPDIVRVSSRQMCMSDTSCVRCTEPETSHGSKASMTITRGFVPSRPYYSLLSPATQPGCAKFKLGWRAVSIGPGDVLRPEAGPPPVGSQQGLHAVAVASLRHRRRQGEEVRFATDSRAGFEPSVPVRGTALFETLPSN